VHGGMVEAAAAGVRRQLDVTNRREWLGQWASCGPRLA
jgi:hypothetical protein